ncbi:MAG: flagellar basal body rod protein FlgB [Pseudomonadales bacterium]|nr:flagellar basal body rod protein FlgB [Pseudomonadales bacterium]
MKISLDNALGLHPDALALRADRANLLARNIAQADTPNYKARDIDFAAVLSDRVGQQTGGASMARTSPVHIEQRMDGSGYDVQYRVPLMPSLDGNTVDVQSEQSRFAENNTRLLASLRFLDGRLSGLRTALRGE